MSGKQNQSVFDRRKAYSVLIVSTLAFTVCFMAWMMFGVMGIPFNMIVDPNGVVVARNLRGEALGKKLEEILK